MARVYYNKLIRDNIPDKIRNNGEACEVRPCADAEEFQQELLKKVAEEAGALSSVRSKDEYTDELADLLVVIDALNHELDISDDAIEAAKQKNLAKKGGFTQRHFLYWSSDGDYTSNETAQGIRLNI